MQSTLKSSFLDKKKYGHAGLKSKKMDHLKFTTTEEVSIADRDYGLMKSSVKPSTTPYPHMDEGVDANLLKARLSLRRDMEIRRSSEMSDLSSMSGTKFGSVTTIQTAKAPSMFVNVDRKLAITQSATKNALSLGTPHPKKGVALNAAVLAKHFLNVNRELKQLDPPKAAISGKKVVRLRALPPGENKDLPLDGEQLSDYSVSVSHLSLDSVRNSLGFAERRRIFNMGEFTIARYGKKMSDLMMPPTPLKHMVDDHHTNIVQKAKEEFDRYTQSQGLTKARREQLSWKSEFSWLSSVGSVDTLYPRTQSMADIKIRQYVRSQTQHRDSSYSGH